MENEKDKNKPLTVSAFLDVINESLKEFQVSVIGEVSRVTKIPTTVFFTLKDEENESVLECKIWKYRYEIMGIEIKEGMKLVVSGYPDIYKKRGSFNFFAETVELSGEGELKKAYEKLKNKLTEEGLFAEERKRPLPQFPQKVGVITSLQSGTVIHDFEANLGKFGFHIYEVNSRVEGQTAVPDLINAIHAMRNMDIEVLVIMRGGGSLESIAGFNNEALVKEVVKFPVPVIAAIGHEADITLVALAADVAVSTATAAAEILNDSWEKAQFDIERLEYSIIDSFDDAFDRAKIFLYRPLGAELSVIKAKIQSVGKDFEKLIFHIVNKYGGELTGYTNRMRIAEQSVRAGDPLRQLQLGYSVVRIGNKILHSVKNVKIDNDITIQLSDGSIHSKIKEIQNNYGEKQ